jgi:hypothetical protein
MLPMRFLANRLGKLHVMPLLSTGFSRKYIFNHDNLQSQKNGFRPK